MDHVHMNSGRHALLVAVALAFAGPSLAAEPAHGHAAGDSPVALKLNQGKRWGTDAPLRKGMDGIRNAFAADLQGIHSGKETRKQYAALAGVVDKEVAYIVQNCKLPPEADAQLHLVIGEVMAGSEAMRGKVKAEPPSAGAVRVVKALEAYGTAFDHPGWKALE